MTASGETAPGKICHYIPAIDEHHIASSEGSQLVEIPCRFGSPQKPTPETQHFHKFQLNARLGDAATQQLWKRLRAWPQAEKNHALLTPPPVTSNEESSHN